MSFILKALAIVLLFGSITPLYGADNPNILVMSEDSDQHTIARDSRVTKSVISALQNQLFDMHFNVYDETVVSLDSFTQSRSRRSDAELFTLARSVKRPPIDIVVVFSIYANTQVSHASTHIKTRMSGRMVSAHTGKFLGEFSVDSGKLWNAPTDCNRECMAEIIEGKARILANDLGAVLAEKLNWIVNGEQEANIKLNDNNDMVSDFYLVFDGFNTDDYMQIEEYLVIFSGYQSLRPTEQWHIRTEVLYRSSATTAKLSRNIKKMLEELNMRATVNFEGNTFTVKRITLRGQDPSPTQDNGW
jgi:hypothetical protein